MTFSKFRLAAALFAVGTACAWAQPADKPSAKPRATPPAGPVLPNVDLSPQILYKLMLAEIAAQRGQMAVAVQGLLDVARETGDPRVAQRATEVAWNARMPKEALEAASLWLKADPGNAQAQKVVVTLLVNQEKPADSKPALERWLASDKANVGPNFVQLSQLFARQTDKKGVYELLRDVARPYINLAEVRLSLAQAAWNAGDAEASLAQSAAALKIKPDLELAALFHAQALQKRSNAEALTFLGGYVQTQPKAREARLSYARLLAGEKRQAEAREQFEILLREAPKNPEIAMSVAVLAMQVNDLDAAEKYLNAALAAGHKQPDAIWLMLGQLNEDRKQYDEALKWYGGISSGERYLAAQARYSAVLAKQGKLDAARKHLQGIQPSDDAQRIQLIQAEANLLREANDHKSAYELLGKALEGAPDSVDLLYDQAMIAEKLDRLDVLETNLRRVIELQPEHAHAHNALGYTLADRNMRLPEARKLIERALQLAPQDGYIIDSLGWVLYRMGNTKEALVHLRRAFELRPEAEVGAHLGEVLWMDGKRDEARKIWRDMLKEGPTNDTLLSTLKRLEPSLLPATTTAK